jgi:hypothetical protein
MIQVTEQVVYLACTLRLPTRMQARISTGAELRSGLLIGTVCFLHPASAPCRLAYAHIILPK